MALPGCDLKPACPASTPPGKLALFNPATKSFATIVSLPAGYGQPLFVALDPTGKVWFTMPVTNAIGVYDPVASTVNQFAVPTASAGPWDLAFAPSGKLWFTEHYTNQIGSFDPSSATFSEIPTPATNSNPYGITVDASSNVWFTENTDSVALIAEYTSQGALEEFRVRSGSTTGSGLTPHLITVDRSGNIWWSEGFVGAIATLNVASAQPGTNTGVTEYPYTATCGTCGKHTSGIHVDGQGLVWFDDSLQNFFGSLPVSGGSFSLYTTPSGGHLHDGLNVDGQNRIWFDEEFANNLGVATQSTVPPTTTTTVPPTTTVPSSGQGFATDTFVRANQSGWGTASDGQVWGGDANTKPTVFSISGNAGVAKTNGTTYSAVLGPTATDAEVYATGSETSFTNSNFGPVLRWVDANDWYKAYVTGTSLVLQKKVAGTATTVASTPFAATSGVSYSIHFRAVGSTLSASAWPASSSEPSTWMVTANDTSLTTGQTGLRLLSQGTGTVTVTSFQSGTPGFATPPPTTVPPNPPAPTGAAAADLFQRTTTSGWSSADSGGWWTVVGSPWSWSVAPGHATVNVGANSEERAYLSQFTVRDVDVVQKEVLPRCQVGNCEAAVLGRYVSGDTPSYYRVGAAEGVGRATILLRAQRSDGTALNADIDTGLPAAGGVVVWQRVEFLGVNPTTIRARVWLDGTPEPSNWMLDVADSTAAEQAPGMVGVRLRNEDTGGAQTFQIQSYQVTGSAAPVVVTPNPTSSAHLLYVVVDGTVSVYDIDNNHALVKQFAIPEAGKRGVIVAPNRAMLYISECGRSLCAGQHGSLLAYDLVHDVVAWVANYSLGVDQPAITPDGATIYMPHGTDASDGSTSILDAGSGQPIGAITTGTNGHNTVVALDGSQLYLTGYSGATSNYAHVYNPATNAKVLDAGPTVRGIRPFTVNGAHTLMFTTSSDTCGFQVLDLTTGAVLYTVPFPGSCTFTASSAPSHGISLSPDERRLFVMDAALDQVMVYDVSTVPSTAPSFVAAVPLGSITGYSSPCQSNCEREGWLLNDLSGRYVYVGDTGDVISTTTLASIATLPALQNTRLMVEIDWVNGIPSGTSTRFGLGRVTH